MARAGDSHLYNLDHLLPYMEQGFSVLTPNFRLARRIKQEWDKRQLALGRRTWNPARVDALENWFESCWQQAVSAGEVPARSLLDPAGTRELWLRVIQQEQAASGTYSLLQPAAAADLALAARETLLRWQVDTTIDAVRSQFQLDTDCATYLCWLQRFEEHLAQGELTTRDDCVRDLLVSRHAPGEQRLLLLDFDTIPPLYRSALEALSAELLELESPGEMAATQAYSFPDKVTELQAVARWACELHTQQPETTAAVVLVDMQSDRAALEYQLRREFDCLGDNYNSLPVNFSTGISLERTPVVRDALRILDSTGRQIALTDVVALLQSRFTGQDDRDSDLVGKFLQRLYDNGLEKVDTRYLRAWAQQVKQGDLQGLAIGRLLSLVSKLRLERQKQLPSQWTETFIEVLDNWGWPGLGPLDSLEYQQVESWYQALEKFASYDLVLGRLGLADAAQALRRHCQGQASQPQTADSNIQVLGTLEAAGLSFETLWLVGLQGSRWPPAPRPNPFIPAQMQRHRQMPHSSSEREWRYAEKLMHQYLRASSSLCASYCTELDGVPELPSALLSGMPLQELQDKPELPKQWLAQHAANALERIEEVQAPPVNASELEQLRGGSSILEDQANCPFRAFARKRLGLEPLGDYRWSLSAAERGTILHDALYVLWGELHDSNALHALDQGQSRVLAEQAANSAIESVPADLRQLVGSVCLDLEGQRLCDLLLQWLQIERQREPFTVVHREQAVEASIRGIPLRLRVDRVDELASGQRLLIDYKSGRGSLADWLGPRPPKPQLPLYGTVGTSVSALAYAEVRSRESRLLALGEVEGEKWIKSDIEKAVKRYSEAENWQALLAEWRQNLESLAQAFLDGDAQVDPLSKACDYCGLESVCRVHLPMEEGA